MKDNQGERQERKGRRLSLTLFFPLPTLCLILVWQIQVEHLIKLLRNAFPPATRSRLGTLIEHPLAV
jgi:hypothetical protein